MVVIFGNATGIDVSRAVIFEDTVVEAVECNVVVDVGETSFEVVRNVVKPRSVAGGVVVGCILVLRGKVIVRSLALGVVVLYVSVIKIGEDVVNSLVDGWKVSTVVADNLKGPRVDDDFVFSVVKDTVPVDQGYTVKWG